VSRAGAALVLGVVLGASAAHASDVAAAEALFRRGLELMEAWRLAEACPLIEESVRLDYGAAAEFRLAECLEKSGRVASAWARYTNVTHISRQQAQHERAVLAARKASELLPKLPYLMVAVSATVAAVPGLVVMRGEAAVGPPQWGVPVPVDPGAHTVEARAPGYRAWATTTSLVIGERRRVYVEVLEPAAPPAPVVTTVQVAPEPRAGPGWPRTAGLVSGGLGALGLAAGVVVGVLAKGQYDEAVAAECDALGCSSRGLADVEAARGLGDGGTVLSVAGAVALTAGLSLVLWSVLDGPP